MTQAPFHNPESFQRAIVALIDRVDGQERGADLDRLYQHVTRSPDEVSDLASFLFMLDDDYRPLVTQAIDAHRRWIKTKGRDSNDQDIAKAMIAIYRQKRGL